MPDRPNPDFLFTATRLTSFTLIPDRFRVSKTAAQKVTASLKLFVQPCAIPNQRLITQLLEPTWTTLVYRSAGYTNDSTLPV